MIRTLVMLMLMKMAEMNDHSDDGDADVYGNDTGMVVVAMTTWAYTRMGA